jgi:LPXTG-motif cell wall-anchored protein
VALSVPAPARRVFAAVAAALLAALTVLTVTAAPAVAAAPSGTDVPAAAAAGWLARQFVDGDHLETSFDGQSFPDAGLTLDAVLAFAAAQVAGDQGAAAMRWVGAPANLETYVGNGTTDSFPGALAKLSLTAEVEGLDPTAFGSGRVDLLARLRALITPSGRFSDKSSFVPYTDFSNGFSQSYAVLALARAGGPVPPTAVSFLAGTACPGGGYPLSFGKPTCTPDPDATSVAVQALAAAGAGAAASAGVRWLLSDQKADGSYGGGESSTGPNANSTGLVGQALRSAGETSAADRAAAYLRTLQSGCTATATRRGAIAFDATGFLAATAPRATAQAVLGLAGSGLFRLDGTDAAAGAPVLACPAPPTTPAPPTHAPTQAPTTHAPTGAPTTHAPTGAPTTSPAAVPAPSTSPAAFGGTLPNTGASPLPVVYLGIGLIVVGTALALLARRRPDRS